MPWAPDYSFSVADFVRAADGDGYVDPYATAASRAIDTACNRQFGRLDEAGTFEYDTCGAPLLDNGRWLLLTDDIPATGDLVVVIDGTTIDAGVDGYQVWPPNNIAKGLPALGITLAERPYGVAAVTNRFGWLATPDPVFAAVRLQVNRWHIRRESPYGTAGSPADGSEIRLSARLDPDVRAVLAGGGLVRARMPR